MGHRTVLVQHDREAFAGKAALATRTISGGLLAAHRPKRCDTVIASTLLVLLLAGWVMNFVSVKQVSLGLGIIIASAVAHQT